MRARRRSTPLALPAETRDVEAAAGGGRSCKGMNANTIVITRRWVNTAVVVGHPKLKGLRHVRICNPPARSRFWRWHVEGEGHICTAEATYLILKDFEEATGLVTRGGRLEDILFLFALVASRIKAAYDSDPRKAGMSVPTSEEAKRRRRLRLVRLDRLVKTKYKGLDAVRDRDGEEAAIEEFFRRRRGESVYQVPKGAGTEEAAFNAEDRPSAQSMSTCGGGEENNEDERISL